MSIAITVRRLHVSFLWTESFAALLSVAGRDAPMASLGQRHRYADQFVEARNYRDALTPPWTSDRSNDYNRFWYYYSGGRTADKISGDIAWRRLIPFHRAVESRARWNAPDGRLILDGFYYPHGIAFALTLVLEFPIQRMLALADVVTLAARARNEALYRVELSKTSRTLRADPLAVVALDQLRRRVVGNYATPGHRDKPFTIATLIAAEADDPQSLQPAEGDEIHLALQGLCRLHLTWQDEKPPAPLKEHTIKTCFAPADLVYGQARSRAVWFPTMFLEKKRQIHTLSCYHHNLLMLSLQTEMLGHLLRLFGEYLDGSALVPPALHNLAESAVVALSGLYGGAYDTYQSWSAREQIEQCDLLKDLNRARQYFGFMELAA